MWNSQYILQIKILNRNADVDTIKKIYFFT